MPTKISKRLVIDASVARSCGNENATFPTSKHCRDFLQEVLRICHRAVMTPEIKTEWDKHQSSFARKWKASMVAKKKLEYLSAISIDRTLRNRIDSAAESDKEREAMWKDILLIEAALMTDKIVVSIDEKARKPFSKAAAKVSELQAISWLNPDKLEETPLEWLAAGAKVEKKRLLGQ